MFQRVFNSLRSGIAAVLQGPKVNIVLALLVLGLSAVVACWNLAIGIATAIWLGLVMAMGLYWMRRLRAAFPAAPWVFPVSFALVLLFVLLASAAHVTDFDASRTTAQIRLEAQLDPPVLHGQATAPGLAALDPRFLNTESAVINSATLLGEVVENLDLATAFSSAPGTRLRNEEALHILQRTVVARTITDENWIELRVSGRSEGETSRLVDAIFTVYERSLTERQRVAGRPERIRAALENKASVTRSARTRLLPNLAGAGIVGLWLASIACAGAAFWVWLHQPRGRRFATFLPVLVFLALLLLIALAAGLGTPAPRPRTSARVRLVAGDGLSEPATWAAGNTLYDREALDQECVRLSSPQFLAQVLRELPGEPNADTIDLKAVRVPQTSLVDFWASAANTKTAAAVANAAARVACSQPREANRRVELVDPATSPLPGEARSSSRFPRLMFIFTFGFGVAWIGSVISRFSKAMRNRQQASRNLRRRRPIALE